MNILLLLLLTILLLMFLRAFVALGEAEQTSRAPHWDSRPGIWFSTHRAKRSYKYQHLFLRLTPHNPIWAERYPEIFKQRDRAGLPFATLGAGPKEGMLFLEFNRGFDLNDPVSYEAESPSTDSAEEDRRLTVLLEMAAQYSQELRFSSFGPWSGPGYNCNAIISALARGSQMRLPRFSKRFMLCPGVFRPVPRNVFLRPGRPEPRIGT